MDNWTGPPEREEDADSNISTSSLPPDPPGTGTYYDYHFESIKTIQTMLDSGQRYLKVKFSGFPLVFISRRVLEVIPFRSSSGCCVDSCFSLDLDKKGIEQYSDLEVRSVHINSSELRDLKTGIEEPDIIFEKRKG